VENRATSEFKLRITKALADQLAETLDPLVPASLTADAIADLVEPRPGVYQLYHRGALVYVGKASRNLRDRLSDHQRKLSGRRNIDLLDVRFKCAYVDEDLDAAAPETLLIKKYQAVGEIPWNNNGFGSHDQGRNRDHQVIKESHFDAHFPIDLDYEVTLDGVSWALAELLERVNALAPYTVRREKKDTSALQVLQEIVITIDTVTTVGRVIERTVRALPEGWQATVLPGALILYPESTVYQSALGWYRSSDAGEAVWTPHKMRVDPGR
jgi:hypothetical protein